MEATVNKLAFSDLKAKITNKFKELAKTPLFYVDVDRDEVWEQYLNGFDIEDKQEHNCNCCKSFLRQFAGIVTIVDNKVVSLWDGLTDLEQYSQSVENLKNYIHSRPVTNIFLAENAKAGTDKNTDLKKNIVWSHFFLSLPANYVTSDLGPKLNDARTTKTVLKRGLEELTQDATETVLELIAQNSLYRGKEFEPIVKEFLTLQKQFKLVKPEDRDAFCWLKSLKSGAVSRIRNTAIGTLLEDLSIGIDLDSSVTKFERVVAPTNYKRPTSLVTPKMVEQAKAKLMELGLLDSLERRYANEADISIKDVIFSDKSYQLTDVFQEVAKTAVVNPKSLTKIEEISIEDFITNVVPSAKSISVLLENSHMGNMVSLLASKDREVPSLFKWDNNFSWNYTGGITDSIKERVKAAGGNVVGELRTSLSWSNFDDLDIHVVEPNGNKIYYAAKHSISSGKLDVDMNAGGGRSRTPVENIIWTNKNQMKEGKYQVIVHNFNKRESTGQGFTVQIECNGETAEFDFQANPKSGEHKIVTEFDYSKTNGIVFKGTAKTGVSSKEKWGLGTNQFHKVTKMMLSPNHWSEKPVGNKHYFFMLENCKSDETPRPFFNEFLKPELDEHRKVFEILGSKVKIDDSDNQLSGVGFSETQRADLIVQVEGKFKRTLRVKI